MTRDIDNFEVMERDLYLKEKELYLESIETLAKEKISLVYKNKGNEYAAIVLSRIFKYSDSTVRIFANSLSDSPVTRDTEYRQFLRTFIEEKGGVVKVLLEQEPISVSEVYKYLLEKSKELPDRVFVKIANEKVEMSEREINFTVGDSDKFRIEVEKEERKAFGSFNDVEYSKKLIDIFEAIFSKSKSIK